MKRAFFYLVHTFWILAGVYCIALAFIPFSESGRQAIPSRAARFGLDCVDIVCGVYMIVSGVSSIRTARRGE